MTQDLFAKTIVGVSVVVAAIFVYQAYEASRPCVEPIAYTLGAYDSRFNISQSAFIENLEKAATMWNKAAGRELFVYSAKGGVPVRLVFDTRQQTANLGGTIDQAQTSYELHKAQVEQKRVAYESASDAYEQKVMYWNARGGAPKATYQELEKERLALAQELSALQAAINALNAEARAINSQVGVYNAGVEETFEAGKYYSGSKGEYIELYEFTNTTQLVRLAAHEFGHALGLDHVEGVDSIMYEENKSKSLSLSSQDFAALTELCHLK